jgi:hypothetical protein
MILTGFLAALAAQAYPAPAPDPDEASSARGIQRTMTLLATSTPERRHTVRILFYGQSITEQAWTKAVAEDLRARFPHADLRIENRAIGGFASQLLIRTAEHDLYPFYPDLLIFYVYGDHTKYDEIIRQTRRRTTAEVLMQTEHVAAGDSRWPEMMSNQLLPEIARKYGCELLDQRKAWKRYLEDQKLEAKALLKDDVHLNDRGNWLMAELVKRRLRHDPRHPRDPWKDLVREVVVEKDAVWSGGKLVLEFEGNRVDAVAEGASSASATVRVDGKPPSEFPEAYAFTRPNETPGWVWVTGVVSRVDWEKPRIAEDWTLRLTEFSGPKSFRYSVTGSRTGPDGEGSSAARFVSTSGRVALSPADFFFENAMNASRKTFAPGFEIKWTCRPLFVETYRVPPPPGPGIENATPLVQGIPNGKHTLELAVEKGAPPPIRLLRIYRPPLN